MANTQFLAALRRAVARPQQNQFVARVRSQAQSRSFASGPSSSSSGAAQDKAKQALEGAQKGLERAAEVAKRLGGGVGERVGSLLGGASFVLGLVLGVVLLTSGFVDLFTTLKTFITNVRHVSPATQHFILRLQDTANLSCITFRSRGKS